MAKRVRIGIEVDESFIRLLWANVTLRGLHEKDELDAADQLTLVACAEMRGMLPEQTHMAILPMWRPHIHAVDDARVVIEAAPTTGTSVPTEGT